MVLCGDCKLRNISQQTGAAGKHRALLLAELCGFTQQRPWAGTTLEALPDAMGSTWLPGGLAVCQLPWPCSPWGSFGRLGCRAL